IFKVMDHISYISLANLILNKEVFKELVQEDFTSENVVAEIRAISAPGERRTQMLADYALIRESLGGTGASKAIAESIYSAIALK
ncbi:MAG: hypothetical protein J6W07_06115, partial [Bacteroidales bacterium]|nr:hypothetical protein [Bacteroidales bacterium]